MRTLLDYVIVCAIAGGIAIVLFSTIGAETSQAIDKINHSLQAVTRK